MLALKIALNLNPDASHEGDKISDNLPKKNLEFLLSNRAGTVTFNFSLLLLKAEVDLIPEEKSRKWHAFWAYSVGHVKMLLALSKKVIAFYVEATIVQIGVSSLKNLIIE